MAIKKLVGNFGLYYAFKHYKTLKPLRLCDFPTKKQS